MKLKKISSSYLIKNNNIPNLKYNYKKYSSNILLNKYDPFINLKLPRKKTTKNIKNKNAVTSYNLNSKNHSNIVNSTIINNSQKLLISKSNSDLRYKTDYGICNNSTNSSTYLRMNKKRTLSKNFSSRNFGCCGKSFDLLKLSNDEIFSNSKNNKIIKCNYSLKNSNKLKMFKLIKNKTYFNSYSRKKDKIYNKNNNIKKKKSFKNLYNLLPKKNLLKNRKINFSSLFGKYFFDFTNYNLYQNDKENINSNFNSSKNMNKNKYNKNIIITNNNMTTNKNIINNNKNKSMYMEYKIKFMHPNLSSKKKAYLPFHPNSKIINKTEANQYYSKNKINLTENNIPFDNKKLTKAKRQLSTRYLMQSKIKNKIDKKIINNSDIYELNCFSDKSHIKNKSKIKKNNKINIKLNSDVYKKLDDNNDSYEGVELGHFKIVRVIQNNKAKNM